MTRKSALAGLPLGGGKAVIIGDPPPGQDRTPAGVHGRLRRELGWTLPDRRRLRHRRGRHPRDGHPHAHVGGLQSGAEHGGDPSPTTAFGVYLAMRAAVGHRLGRDTMDGLRVAIQGLGQVGLHLAGLLTADGARVFGTDVQADLISRAVAKFGIAPVADPAEILARPPTCLRPVP